MFKGNILSLNYYFSLHTDLINNKNKKLIRIVFIIFWHIPCFILHNIYHFRPSKHGRI